MQKMLVGRGGLRRLGALGQMEIVGPQGPAPRVFVSAFRVITYLYGSGLCGPGGTAHLQTVIGLA